MADDDGKEPETKELPVVAGVLVGNAGEPISLKNFEMVGFAAENVQPKPGEDSTVCVWSRLSITSDHRSFHRIAEGLADYVSGKAMEVGQSVLLNRANAILVVVRPDKSAELWIDAAATALGMRARRSVRAGEAIFQNDVVDVVGLKFPKVQIDPGDRVIYLFREGWRFGLYFDLEGIEDVAELSGHLGTLFRGMAYRHVYDSVANSAAMDRLIGFGWFPLSSAGLNRVSEDWRSVFRLLPLFQAPVPAVVASAGRVRLPRQFD
jgi:hypothetical protein